MVMAAGVTTDRSARRARREHPLKFKSTRSNDPTIRGTREKERETERKKKDWTGPGVRPNSTGDNGDVTHTQRALLVTSHGP